MASVYVVAHVIIWGYINSSGKHPYLTATFQSLQPFLDAGIPQAALDHKRVIRGRPNTLFIESPPEGDMFSFQQGAARFLVDIGIYPCISYHSPVTEASEAALAEQVRALQEEQVHLKEEAAILRDCVRQTLECIVHVAAAGKNSAETMRRIQEILSEKE